MKGSVFTALPFVFMLLSRFCNLDNQGLLASRIYGFRVLLERAYHAIVVLRKTLAESRRSLETVFGAHSPEFLFIGECVIAQQMLACNIVFFALHRFHIKPML